MQIRAVENNLIISLRCLRTSFRLWFEVPFKGAAPYPAITTLSCYLGRAYLKLVLLQNHLDIGQVNGIKRILCGKSARWPTGTAVTKIASLEWCTLLVLQLLLFGLLSTSPSDDRPEPSWRLCDSMNLIYLEMALFISNRRECLLICGEVKAVSLNSALKERRK